MQNRRKKKDYQSDSSIVIQIMRYIFCSPPFLLLVVIFVSLSSILKKHIMCSIKCINEEVYSVFVEFSGELQ